MITTIILFIIILGILVFVHEFGHFIVAKKSGMQVDEFGFGFPPRLAGIQKVNGKWKFVWGLKRPLGPNQTVYSINSIPLGGFVKIRGENNENEDDPRSFINKSFTKRFFTLVAGVVMNVILAWVLISAGYIIGLPVAVESVADVPAHATFSKPQTAILEVVKDLPADKAGLKANDILLSIDGQNFSAIKDIQNYVKQKAGQSVNFEVLRGRQDLNLKVIPSANPPAGQGPTGIALSLVGRLKYPFFYALYEGIKTTWSVIVSIITGLWVLLILPLIHIFKGAPSGFNFSSLGGPVQIAKLTGQVAVMGFIYLMQFTAFLSLNLAVLNILPFPALDGGRVLFLIIEKIRGKRNNQKVEQYVNTVGFVFLLLLMLAVTVHDIIRK